LILANIVNIFWLAMDIAGLFIPEWPIGYSFMFIKSWVMNLVVFGNNWAGLLVENIINKI